MAQVSVYNMEGKEVGKLDLNDAIFGVEVNEHLVHLAIVQHLANMRQGTQKAKTRSEVSGCGRKPWRQKGTGHARQGSIRAAQWKGGGMIWAPTPRDYSVKMNKKEVRAALRSALTSKVQDNKCIVLDNLSLSEIAEELSQTRQAVHYNLRKAEKALESYEEKLGLVASYKENRLLAQKLFSIIDSADVAKPYADKIKQIIEQITE